MLVNINGKNLSNSSFADDVIILSNTIVELQNMLSQLGKMSNEAGLTVNSKKTKN